MIFIMQSCKKEEDSPPPNETSTVTDSEGIIYKTVKIGNQWWMSENLRTGTMIQGNELSFDNSIIEKYCYDNNIQNCIEFGALYTWDELMAYSTEEGVRGICPEGWHIPTDAEVIELEEFLGMSSNKAHLENTWRGTDEGSMLLTGGSSGFNMPTSGARRTDGYYLNFGLFGYFYTSTESGAGAWRRCLKPGYNGIGRYNTYPKTYALSVRCIKN